MSIQAAITRHVRMGLLFQLEMTVPSDPVVRGFFYSPDVKLLMEGPWTSPQCGSRVALLRADLEAFVKEERVSVCLKPFVAKEAFMGRLNEPEDEVWDVRSRTNSPGLRLFGRFAAPNIFLAFTWAPRSTPWNGRDPMGDRHHPSWEKSKADTKQQWQALFPKHQPHHGEQIHDYITTRAVPV